MQYIASSILITRHCVLKVHFKYDIQQIVGEPLKSVIIASFTQDDDTVLQSEQLVNKPKIH